MENSQKNGLIQTCYIINKRVWFYPELHRLSYSTSEFKQVLSLNIPVSKCLQLLIENKYNVVSRDEFLDNVWKSNGRFVALNTYYQNISMLRKSLRNAGLPENIIITVAKKGLMLNRGADIEMTKTEDIYGVLNSRDNEKITPVTTEETDIAADNDMIKCVIKANSNTVDTFSKEIISMMKSCVNKKISILYFLFPISFIIGAILMGIFNSL